MTIAILGLAGCGSRSGPASTSTSLPAPSEADAQTIEKLPEQVRIQCSFAGIGGGSGSNSSLESVVEQVEAIARRAQLTGQLRIDTQEVIHELKATNAFNKPTCAPELAKRLSQATGIEAE